MASTACFGLMRDGLLTVIYPFLKFISYYREDFFQVETRVVGSVCLFVCIIFVCLLVFISVIAF